jgi:hypothetical protein
MRNTLAPLVVTILIAGGAGFVAGRMALGIETRVAASGALKASDATRPGDCDRKYRTTIAFTARGAKDTLDIEMRGRTCDNVLALVTVTSENGELVFADAARVDALLDPARNPAANGGIGGVAEDYAVIAAGTALPAWPDPAGPIPSPSPFAAISPETEHRLYEKVRIGELPLLRVRGETGDRLFAYLAEAGRSEEIAQAMR